MAPVGKLAFAMGTAPTEWTLRRGRLLEERRNEIGMKRAEAARRIPVSQQALRAWELGGAMAPENIARVAAVLGLDISDLCGPDDDRDVVAALVEVQARKRAREEEEERKRRKDAPNYPAFAEFSKTPEGVSLKESQPEVLEELGEFFFCTSSPTVETYRRMVFALQASDWSKVARRKSWEALPGDRPAMTDVANGFKKKDATSKAKKPKG